MKGDYYYGSNQRKLYILAGPTAVGKTSLSIELAKRNDLEIISADSVQVYKGLDIGSAKIKQEEMRGIRHYLIDVLEPDENFNVARFQKMANEAAAEIYAKNKGLKIIVITAAAAHKETKSRHSSGKMLRDFADVLIDNCCNKQETVLTLNGKSAGPVSSLVSGAIMNNILYRAAEIVEEKRPDFPLPFYKSSNDAGGDENNLKVAEKYKGRILFLD